MTTPSARTLIVLMAGEVMAEIFLDRPNRVRLRYDSIYRSRSGAVPLSVSMPLAAERHKDAVVGPWLDNLLPDDPEVRRRWRRDFGETRTSPFALLRHVGADVAGAAQFVAPERVGELSDTGELVPQSDGDIATRIRAIRGDPTAWETSLESGRFSLAGAQSKFALHRGSDGWALPTGRIPTTHIFKPAMPRLTDQDLNEHLCMSAARRLGMTAPRSQVLEFAGERVFMVERYDRRFDGVRWLRIHQEDMCQALAVHPERKYEELGGPTAADIVGVIRRHVPDADDAATDVSRFVAALVFNWIIAGTDAHAKNFSLLLAPGQVRLAPLYDLNSLLPYVTKLGRQTLAMRIGSNLRKPVRSVRLDDWVAFAKEAAIDPDIVIGEAVRLATAAPDAFSEVAELPDTRALGSDLPQRLVDAVRARADLCLRALTKGGWAPSGSNRRPTD